MEHGGEKDSVGGEGEVFDAIDLAEHFGEDGEIAAGGRFAAGEFKVRHTNLHRRTDNRGDFFVRKDMRLREPFNPFSGHAVDAAKVANISDGNPEHFDGGDTARAGDPPY